MIIELGHYALILALVLSAILSVVPVVGAAKGWQGWMLLGRRGAVSFFGLVSIAFMALVHAYALSDFSVRNVFENSHTMKPILYKLAGAWGNHEGSMLLWVWMLAFWGFLAAKLPRNLSLPFQARVIAVQSMIAFGFILFILMTSNPFWRLDPAPAEGMDLNPLLQDIGLALHPPLLYAGYVGFSISFCFAMAGLMEQKIDAAFARHLKPFVLSAWVFLTLGILSGAVWAYYELGWGGFWFWDPVENASLIPWLAGTALLHSVIVLEKRGALPNWTLFLSILAFSFSLLGTFLVRSGILTSVHAFAADPARGIFILVLLGVAVGGAFLYYAYRAPSIKSAGNFSALSRETLLLLNNLFLFTFCMTVLIGTLYPVILSALDLGSVSVGAPYYQAILVPMLLPFVLLLGVAPFVAWHQGSLRHVARNLPWPFLLTALLVVFVLFLPVPHKAFSGLAFAMGGFVFFSTLCDMMLKTHFLRRFSLPASYFGMVLAHAGIGVLIIGLAAAALWKTEDIRWMKPGDHMMLGGQRIVFLSARTGVADNYNVDTGVFTVQPEGTTDYAYLTPEKRWYPVAEKETSEVALRLSGFDVIYLVLGEQDRADRARFVVRGYHHPLLLLGLTGGAMIAAGGVAGLLRRRQHDE